MIDFSRIRPIDTLPSRVLGRAGQTRAAQWLLGSISRPLAARQWVFVIGCYNSGTTLLANLLTEHPNAFGINREGAFLTDIIRTPEDFGWHRMWCKCIDQVRLAPGELDPRARTRLLRQWSRWATGQGGAFIEKSVVNMLNVRELASAFDGARFIHITRDGYAVAEGIRRKGQPARRGNREYVTYPIELCARQWAASMDEFDTIRDRPDLYQLTYEAFSRQPLQELNRIAAWLDWPAFTDSAAEAPVRVHEAKGVIANQNQRSRERLSDDDYKLIESVAGSQLAAWGYRRLAP